MTNNDIETTPVDDATPGADTADQEVDTGDDQLTETFPRSVVQRLRKEAADHRERTKDVEGRLAAVQRQSAEQRILAAGMQPAAVWAVTQLDDVLAADGSIDTDKLKGAMAAARSTLGVGRRRPVPDGELLSGAGNGKSVDLSPRRESFATAFRRRPPEERD